MADHWDVAIAALRADGLNVHDGDPKLGDAFPYLVVYRPAGRVVSDRVSADRNVEHSEGQVTSVGLSSEAARVVGRRARAILTSRLPVEGRRAWRGEHLSSQPVRRDEDVADRAVFYGTDQYRLSST